MRRKYLCPKCNGTLNPNVKIILKAECARRAALLLFSPQPGNYDVIVPESFRLKKHDVVRFSCPLCAHDFTSTRDPSMAEIRFAGPGGQSGLTVFSRTFGHHETYFVTKEEVRSYGEHAGRAGMNFWGVGPKG
ncbi:MAG: hypothetical protein AB1806_20495 [Acidobacteriota bacterium]